MKTVSPSLVVENSSPNLFPYSAKSLEPFASRSICPGAAHKFSSTSLCEAGIETTTPLRSG